MSTKQVDQINPPKLAYTIPEAARVINLSERQLRRLCRSGEINAKWLGGRILIPTDVLIALLDNAPSAAE